MAAAPVGLWLVNNGDLYSALPPNLEYKNLQATFPYSDCDLGLWLSNKCQHSLAKGTVGWLVTTFLGLIWLHRESYDE